MSWNFVDEAHKLGPSINAKKSAEDKRLMDVDEKISKALDDPVRAEYFRKLRMKKMGHDCPLSQEEQLYEDKLYRWGFLGVDDEGCG